MKFSPLRRSFNSHGSYKRTRKIPACGNDDEESSFHEELPILLEYNQRQYREQQQLDEEDNSFFNVHVINNNIALMSSGAYVGSGSDSSSAPRDVIVKIDSADDDGDDDRKISDASKVLRANESGYRRDDSNNMYNENSNIGRVGGGSEFSFKNMGNDGSCGGDTSDGNFRIPEQQDPAYVMGQFYEKLKETGVMEVDLDSEMDELRQDNRRSGLPPLPMNRQGCQSQNPSQGTSPVSGSVSVFNYGSRETRVSFKETPVEHSRRRSTPYNELGDGDSTSSNDEERDEVGDELRPVQQHSRRFMSSRDNTGEVLMCTSNAAFETTLTRMRTNRSRLMDPAPSYIEGSGKITKSGQLRSGMLEKGNGGGGGGGDDDDDDPFLDEDLPEELRKEKINTIIMLEWVSLILLIGALICSLAIPALREERLWELQLWKWEVMILVLICGRLVSGWGIRILVFCIERNFLLRKRVLYFVYGLRTAVQNCIWLGLVLLAWHLLFDKRVEREAKSNILPYVTKVLVCFLIAALVWLLKTLIVKVLASSFHVNAFFDRIQDSLFNQFVIETLSGPPLYEIQRGEEEVQRTMAEVQMHSNAANMFPDLSAKVFAQGRSGRFIPPTTSGRIRTSGQLHKAPIGQSSRFSGPISKKLDDGITIDQLHKLNQKNVSAWNMKRLMKLVRHGALTTLDEHILDSTVEDESSMQIRSEVEAKAAAKKIFHNVAKPRARFMNLEDIMRFMGEVEALKTVSLFEGASETERISKSALKNWVVNAFRERRALALTLNDTKTAVNRLHQIVNVIVSIIILVIWLIILNLVTSKFLLFCSSQIVLVAFVFGNTCKNTFESIIFLFVIHPFDVGDRCEIDGVQVIVEEMDILTTTFLRFDNQKIVYPNFVLFSKPISNYYRSPDMGDAVEICFHILTPPEKVALMKQKMVSYIENNKEHWYPQPIIVLKDVEGLTHLRIAIWLQHRMNHQDMGERWARRALFVEECVKICRELDVEFRMAPVNINVRSMPTPISYNQSSLQQQAGSEEIVHR